MSTHLEDSLEQFHGLVAELEAMAKSAAGEGGAEPSRALRDALASARTRLREAERALEGKAGQGAGAIDGFVRENAWASVGIAAALAFVLGALVARRD